MDQNHYQILGLEPAASAEAIRKRFRELARRYHPDVGGDPSSGHQRFVRIVEAYQVLKNPSLRADYDQRLQEAAAPRPARGVTVGARVEVDFGELILVCRLRSHHGEALHLAAPAAARRSGAISIGAPVRLNLYQGQTCLEAEATTLQWVWTQPPLLVVGAVTEWREKQRRRERRAPRELAARVLLDRGGEYAGLTRDVSVDGVSLLVAGPVTVSAGAAGRLTLQVGADTWCEAMPIRIARVRNWLRTTGSTVEIGAEIRSASDAQRRSWQQCLACLGVEADS